MALPVAPPSSCQSLGRALAAATAAFVCGATVDQARAQPPPAASPAPAPPAAAAAGPATPAVPVVDPAVTAEAPIVAGNRAAAKERAVTEALRQALARAYSELLAEPGAVPNPAAPAVASLKAAWSQHPKRYVRTYNVLEEGEHAGYMRVKVLADVDDLALRRDLDRAISTVSRPGPSAAARGAFLFADAESLPAAESVNAVLGALGMGAEVRALGRDGKPPADAARPSTAGRRAWIVRASINKEGAVRGTLVQAVACDVSLAPITPTPGGAAVPPVRKASERGFDAREDVAAARCVRAAAQAAVRAALPDLGASGSDQREGLVYVVLTSSEPGALVHVLGALRQTPGVSGVARLRLHGGRAEAEVQTRLAGDALAAALRRASGAAVVLTTERASTGRLELGARLNDSLSPASAPPPVPPAQPPPAAQP